MYYSVLVAEVVIETFNDYAKNSFFYRDFVQFTKWIYDCNRNRININK